jgi:hypothetical protein
VLSSESDNKESGILGSNLEGKCVGWTAVGRVEEEVVEAAAVEYGPLVKAGVVSTVPAVQVFSPVPSLKHHHRCLRRDPPRQYILQLL